jgi:hypothetical protein
MGPSTGYATRVNRLVASVGGLGCALVVGCGTGRSGQPESSSQRAVDTGASSGAPPCTAEPTTLVPPFWLQPDAFESQIGDVAVTDTDIYFTLFMPSSLWRVPIRGGQPTALMAIPGGEDQMLTTSTSIVLAESHQGMSGQMVRWPIAGGPAATLAATSGWVTSLATDGADIYFADSEGVKVVPLDGGSVRTLVSQTGTITLVGSNVILADRSGGNVFSVPKVGGRVTTLAANQPGATLPVACGTAICWMAVFPCAGVPDGSACIIDDGEGALVYMEPAATPVMLARDQLLYSPTALAFDGSNFFVLRTYDFSPSHRLSRVPRDGGSPVAIGSANSIAVTNGCLYATNFESGVYGEASSYTPSP